MEDYNFTLGIVVFVTIGIGHTSESLVTVDGIAVSLIIATTATERLTRIAYTFAKPRNPIRPRI